MQPVSLKIKAVFRKWSRNLYIRVLFAYFLAILIASFLLMMPFSWKEAHSSDKSWNFLNSFYMAASAFSTTGLTIYDLGEHMSFWGQMFILLCIFCGGIGLLFFKFWLFKVVIYLFRFENKNYLPSAREQHFERGYFRFKNSKEMILTGFYFIFFIQFIGGLWLFFYFALVKIDKLNYYGNWDKSAWSAIFHSVSATNNAGFDIFQDGIVHNSLESLSDHYLVQMIFIIQFILGGLGFPVFFEFWKKFRTKKGEGPTQISFFIKFILFFYFIFLVFSIIVIITLEYSFSDSRLGKQKDFDSTMHIVFNTLSSRSAGYSTTDINSGFNDVSKYFLSFFMWVGCAPVSTGGGIKVTTFAILFLSLFRPIDSNNNFLIWKTKRISLFNAFFAYKIFFISLILIFIFSSAFLLQNKLGKDNKMLNAIFQSTSALGNVGLTTLNNKNLINNSYAFKIITISLMLIGQIGLAQIVWLLKHKSNISKNGNTNLSFSQQILF